LVQGRANLLPTAGGASHATAPASSSQRRTWFTELIAPGEAQHHLGAAIEIFGPLDLAALQLGLDLVVDRHDILRTKFADQ
jgi:hypothetical protein